MAFDSSPIAQAIVQWWLMVFAGLIIFAPGAFLGGWLFALGQFFNRRWLKILGVLYFICGLGLITFLLMSGVLKDFFKTIK